MRLLLGLCALALPAALVGVGGTPLSLPLKAEELPNPGPSFTTLEFDPLPNRHFAVRLLPGDVTLQDLDLTLLVPHVPRLALGNEALTRLALAQREFNRNEVHNDLGGGRDLSLANNCLRQGLWEVKVAEGGKMRYHAWFDFPKADYARLFHEATGSSYANFESVLGSYPTLDGIGVPLTALRTVLDEHPPQVTSSYPAEGLLRFAEQESKRKLLLSPNIGTYGDFTAASNQPIVTSKFCEPGRYSSSESMRFDLSWLAQPKSLTWRRVKNPRIGGAFPEIEVEYANGRRLLVADSRIATLAPRTGPPQEADVLKIVAGIGTPDIHASTADRARELSEDRPRYFMVLDGHGNHVDNHLNGIDGVVVWRESGEPGLVHLSLVSYERIAILSHISAPWQWSGESAR